jgi:CubicO group peptidase (beta-lactamase class C family)
MQMPQSFAERLTRRTLFKRVSGASLLGLGSGLVVLSEPAPAQAAPTFAAYHGVTAAVHQANFDQLSRRQFRPISLSVYGDPPNVLYAAVWVDGPGPAFAAVHGLNARDYQAAFDFWRSRDYAPTIVTAAGRPDNALFAAVFEQQVPGPGRARHGITEAEFADECRQAANARQKLRWASIYGTPDDRRFVATWHANPGYAKWHAFARVAPNEYQGLFDAQTQLPQFRPTCVSVASDHALCALFTDEGIGSWVARHGMTSAEYQAEFDRQRAAGRMPVCVQGGGTGNDIHYAAIFAGQDQPSARRWTAIGEHAANLNVLDDLMRAFMVKHAVRAAQLTLARDGAVQLQRAYTWAEPDYPTTQVSDRFLLASNSKMFVAAAVRRLYDARRLRPASHAYPRLGFTTPKDARSDRITMQQLLDHRAGYTYDPTYDMRRVALARSLIGPAGKRDVAAHMYARDLDYAPGAAPDPKGWIYNNYGYLLASLVVEQVAEQDYFQFLRSEVLQPDRISEVEVYPTAAGGRPPNLIAAEDEALGLSALAPRSDAQVPAVFGGDGMVKETAVGSCGLAASATALTQFIHRHAVGGIGDRTVGARGGSTPGASTWAESRAGGTDWALVLNTRNFAPGTDKAFDGLIRAINTELDLLGL